MSVPDIEREVHSFVVSNFLFGQSIGLQPEDSLLGRGLIDSTGVLELVDFLEE
jgi:acyl carrier protein